MHDASLTWTADRSAIDSDARRAHEIYVEDKGTDIGQPPRRVSDHGDDSGGILTHRRAREGAGGEASSC
jgi:hypothetical protein